MWDYTQWNVVCAIFSHNNEKCETILNEWWCVSWHHKTLRSVRLHSMKGAARVEIMKVDWVLCWGKPGARNLVFFRVQWLQPAMKGTSCVRRVWLGSFQRVIGSSSVFCNEWLFMCAWFYEFVDSLVADRSAMAASRLLGATATCVILVSFAAGHRKS